MLQLKTTSKFRKDLKRLVKQNANLDKLETIINSLLAEEVLPRQNHDHELSGNYRGHRECHIEPDWLLIYHVNKKELILTAVRSGSHSELFNQ